MKTESKLQPAGINALKQHFDPKRLLSEPEDCWAYGCDNSTLHHPPQAVLIPHNTQDVQDALAICHQYAIPFTCRGRGTGTAGAAVPIKGGVVCSFESMNQILHLDKANRVLVAQAGVINQDIQKALENEGFFWPPNPTSQAYCTLGGNLACNAAGPSAVKYGTCRENTLGLEVVTALGKRIHTGVYTTKGVVGYDLTRLMIGSEGTLGVITEATLKLTPLNKRKACLRLDYKDVRSASEAIVSIMQSATIPSALEFIDHNSIQMIRDYSELDIGDDLGAMLMVEVDGPSATLDVLAKDIQKAAAHPNCIQCLIATDPVEQQKMWRTRKALSPALKSVAPKKINEDIVIPIARLPDFVDQMERFKKQFDINIVNFGHAGNGNLHVNLMIDPDDAKQQQRAERCLDAIFDLVLAYQGTLSGEHGIGLIKRPFVSKEIDPESLRLMHAIKQQFDPKGILNPGKTLPDP